jgi:SAM-dependent methyltransferase
MTEHVRRITVCRLCGCADLRGFIDFGDVPLGNNLQTKVEDALAAPSYPLALTRCADCGHFQLGCAVDPEVLYATNYTYLSGIGPSFIKHFDTYADWIAAHCDLPPKPVTVDVGSNDGTCLKAFQTRGHVVCGVDPAQLAAKIANDKGVETINAFFDRDAVDEIKRRHGAADFVTSHNVLAHVDDLAAVFRNVHDLLKDGGYFAFEVGYFAEVLKAGHFDTIYHEHLDYHHAEPLVRHLTALGFDMLDLSVNSIQGGSLRLLLRKSGRGAILPQAADFLQRERQSVVHDEAFLDGWRASIEAKMATFRSLVQDRVAAGRSIAGYGAPTKAILLMKMAQLAGPEIAYVVEDNPHKTGRFFPGTGVAIEPSAALMANPPDVVVLFAWNFVDDILRKLAGQFAKPVEVVVPLPEPRVVTL